MNPFSVTMPESIDDAATIQSREDMPLPVLKAGGIDLLDHWKEGLTQPELVNNMSRLKGQGIRRIEKGKIGTMCTLAQVGSDDMLNKAAPAIAQAARSAATPQIRNVATAGGNILQRPRCWYYRNEQFHCLKKGGHECFAVEGENRYHAIFSDGPCHIVHPSNVANALSVCNGRVRTVSKTDEGGRVVNMANLFVPPDRSMYSEHTLRRDEIVTHIEFDPAPHSAHYEIREKQSFDWPVVMVSAALELDGDTIRSARLCAGAVAPIPWRLPKVEDALKGVSLDDDAALKRVAAMSAIGASPMSDNKYKINLLAVAVRRAVLLAGGRAVDDLFHH